MCGRYALYGPVSSLREQYDARIDGLPEVCIPRFSAAPMQILPAVRKNSTGEQISELLRRRLVPSWSKDETIATKLINARAETLAEKPSFRAPCRSPVHHPGLRLLL